MFASLLQKQVAESLKLVRIVLSSQNNPANGT